jgi:hypothetical protein
MQAAITSAMSTFLSRLAAVASLFLVTAAVGCSADTGDGDEGDDDVADSDSEVSEALSAGVNGSACLHSPYNCKLRKEGGNRVQSPSDDLLWDVRAGIVRDGNAQPMVTDANGGRIKINYGQTRHFAGKTHVMAMSTENKSAGWYPIDAVVAQDTLRRRIGNVDGKDPQMGKLGCYEIRNTDVDPAFALKKVVRDSDSDHERAGDYMPLVRANGKRYANLAFNVAGDGLGSPAIDIFVAGTKFQRVNVPTNSGRPHISLRLYTAAANGAYTKPAGTMAFFYGYIVSADNVKRFGWMAQDALKASTGNCR